jgi:hypothetical protein
MKSMKSQQEMIITVLVILIAIAALIGVAFFITNMSRQSTSSAGLSTKCLSIDLSINSAESGSNTIAVQRGAGGQDIEIKEIKIYVNGKNIGTLNGTLGVLETGTISLNTSLSKGEKVQVAPAIKEGMCGFKAEQTVI